MINNMQINTIQGDLYELLVKYPKTRESDEILYGTYLQSKNIGMISAISFFLNYPKYKDESDVASFETVSRLRRKLQEKYPELAASEKTSEARKELQLTFFDWAKGN